MDRPPADAALVRLRWWAVCLGPGGAVVVYALAGYDSSMPEAARATAAVALWMALWWITEALPLPVTSLLPLVTLPLAGVASVSAVAAPYADKNIFLFMGGFLLALAMQRWQLHRRLALWTVAQVGTSPARLVAGVMAVTAALSMWISNTATAAMMLPIGMSLVQLADVTSPSNVGSPSAPARAAALGKCLMLGIAYAASLGGTGTLVGTPTNLLLAGFAERQGLQLGFARWMLFAAPLMVIYLTLAWWLLVWRLFRTEATAVAAGRHWVRQQLRDLGPMRGGERVAFGVFLVVAVAWLVREPLSRWDWLCQQLPPVRRLDDSMIAVAGAIALFLIPVDRSGRPALTWHDALQLPWGILLLFGGGFSLAMAIQTSQLDAWLSHRLAMLEGYPTWLVMVVVTGVVLAATELTSNTPTLAAFLPVVAGLADALKSPPLVLLIPATLAASCAFMLPVATPPNAIVFGSGYLSMRDMIRSGWRLNLIGLVLIPFYASWLVPWVFRQ
ncbi:MAG: di- and tricarboxylate transporter [Pirellulaceae bacterium]|nr:MAG: di- and tricarboxylate transporter [Pirellulaceae bacterium]